jgi:hypothetical protein
MKLSGANAPLLLSIPLHGGRDQKQQLKDVQIAASEPWQKNHWKGIVSSYRKAPWFEEYETELLQFYRQPEKFLLDWNLKTMLWAIEKLKWKLDIMADTEAEDPGEIQLLNSSNVLEFPVYQQVFADRFGFLPNLSILDLIFCEGPKAVNYFELLNRL